MPFIKLRNKNTDIKVVYNKNKRLDRLSNEYYDSPYYGWLILLANPKYGGMEFDIPEDSVIRIPFPLMDTLREYQQKVDQYILENGNE
jgi:hypothetical protein